MRRDGGLIRKDPPCQAIHPEGYKADLANAHLNELTRKIKSQAGQPWNLKEPQQGPLGREKCYWAESWKPGTAGGR